MSDLIKREDVVDAVVEALDSIDHVPIWVFDKMQKALISIPSADRPKGEWIDLWDNDKGWSIEGQCSICGRTSDRPLGHFCKWCGADMRGKDDE